MLTEQHSLLALLDVLPFCRDVRQGGNIAVGLCFSFPIEHKSIKSGKLLKWTKGFDNEGAIGKDPVQLLKDAFKRRVRLKGANKNAPRCNAYAFLRDNDGIDVRVYAARLMLRTCLNEAYM